MVQALRISLRQGGLRQGGLRVALVGRPSLDLLFADNKSLVDATTGANLVDFTRASSGTYVDSDGIIQSATVNTPRFDHDPATGESLGLLMEEARANLLTYSEQFDQWIVASNSVITPNAAVAPDGTNTADQLYFATTGLTNVSQNATLTQGQQYTFSVYAKAVTPGSNNKFIPYINSLTTKSPPIDFESTSEWQRFSFTFTHTNATGSIPVFILNRSDNYITNVYFWGAQLEEGSSPTSYIPTTSSTVTRAADVAEITGTNFSSWYNQSEGTVFTEAKAPGVSPIVGFDDGGASARWRVGYSGSNNSAIVVVDGGVVQTNINTSANTTPYNQFHKLAGAIAVNSLSLAFNGTLSSDSSLSVPVVNVLTLGASIAFNSYLNGHIKRLSYFPTRLPDATLQNITS